MSWTWRRITNRYVGRCIAHLPARTVGRIIWSLLGVFRCVSCVLAAGGVSIAACAPPGNPLSRRVELPGQKIPIEAVIGAVYLQTGVSLNIQGTILVHRLKLTGASLTVQQVMDQTAVALGGTWSRLDDDYCLVTEEARLDLVGASPPPNEPWLRAALARSLTGSQIDAFRSAGFIPWAELSSVQRTLIKQLQQASFLKNPDRFPASLLTSDPTELTSVYDEDRMATTLLVVEGLTMTRLSDYPRRDWVISVKLENPIRRQP